MSPGENPRHIIAKTFCAEALILRGVSFFTSKIVGEGVESVGLRVFVVQNGRFLVVQKMNFDCDVLTLVVHPPPQVPAQLGRDPGRTGHIVSAILFVPPFSTPNPGIYRVGGTDEWGEPPSLYPSSPG